MPARPAPGPRLIPAHAGKTVRQYGEGPSLRAHPRSRGENLSESMGVSSDQGSSPLTRGKLPSMLHLVAVPGLIPAHAGKTIRLTGLKTLDRAHPRSRGENKSLVGRSVSARGSSPLTRGKLPQAQRAQRSDRLIPAHAGKTAGLMPKKPPLEAHPRSRGENSEILSGHYRPSGSSPLTRGKRSSLLATPTANRLIPAHAGKTSRRRSRLSSTGAHPRSRGENRRDHRAA